MNKIIAIISLVFAVFYISFIIWHMVKAYKDEKQAKTVFCKFMNRRYNLSKIPTGSKRR